MATSDSKHGATEPTLKDVMSMLHTISDKIDKQHARPETDSEPPAKRHNGGSKYDPVMRANIPPGCSWACPTVIERVLYTKDQIHKRVDELAKEVSKDYHDATEDSLVIVGIMAGCYMFMADFTRALTVPHRIDFISASSYGLGTISSSNVKIKKDLDAPVEGKDVLILDEMSDSGKSMECIKKMLLERGAKSVRCCVLLNKASRREVDGKLEYVGYDCPDEFLVGYGMDWAQRFRSLEEIAVVRRSAYEK
eukprot:TRINITY_DN73030_c0_g1_i1.p1 TRINITY_DN73030_c0_g1~~TRINITY_DN73030_c0_g1_i1.p1  ORF type:complete len:251 (+),score=33.79 TRINITY_DN73030_c0_g1_i1:104-856(+)